MQNEYWDSFFQAEHWDMFTHERKRWNGHEDITRMSFTIFSRDRLDELCAKSLLNMQNEIESMTENYIRYLQPSFYRKLSFSPLQAK